MASGEGGALNTIRTPADHDAARQFVTAHEQIARSTGVVAADAMFLDVQGKVLPVGALEKYAENVGQQFDAVYRAKGRPEIYTTAFIDRMKAVANIAMCERLDRLMDDAEAADITSERGAGH